MLRYVAFIPFFFAACCVTGVCSSGVIHFGLSEVNNLKCLKLKTFTRN